MEQLLCKACGIEKDIEQFYLHKKRNYRRPVCKECIKAQKKKRFTQAPYLPGEEWRPAATKLDLYDVSNFGRVRLRRTNQILAQNDWYEPDTLTVTIRTRLDKKCANQRRVAQLVAQAFLPPVEGKQFVGFIDGNWRRCHASNLRWETGANRGPMNLRKRAKIIKLHEEGLSMRQIALRLQVSCAGVSRHLKKHRLAQQVEQQLGVSK